MYFCFIPLFITAFAASSVKSLICYSCTQAFNRNTQSEPTECSAVADDSFNYCIYYQRINLQTGEVEVKHIGKTDSEIVIPESDRVVTASAGVNVCQQYRTLTYESDVFYCITDYCNKANTVCAGLEQQGSSMLSCYNCNINFQRYVDSEPVRCSTSISLPANGYCVYHRVIDTTTNRVTISYRAQPSAEVALPDGTLVNNANGNSQCISRSGNGYESQTFFCQSNFCNDYNSVCRALSVSGDYNKPDDNAAPSASLRILFGNVLLGIITYAVVVN